METVTAHFDLHGIIGISLVNATPSDIETVERQLGPIQGPVLRPADIVIRFVDKLYFRSPLRYLGVDDVGYTDDAFFVFQGKHRTRVNVQIPFHQIGNKQLEIVCESGLLAVPLLIPIINLIAVSKGVLPMHASAITYKNKGILITGWSKGGKTETLLAFAAHGARYIGDEWIYFNHDNQMHGIPEPTRIWYWHLLDMPRYKSLVSRKELIKLKILDMFVKLIKGTKLGITGGRLADLLSRQMYVQLPPEKLFGPALAARLFEPDKIFLVASRADPDILIQPIDAREIAAQMVFSLREERKELLSFYTKFRFAFPSRSNNLIDNIEEYERKLLHKILTDRDAYIVYHPYPFSIHGLFDVIDPYCN